MAESAQIQRVSVKHDAIMNFILVNPTVPMGIVAAHFKVSPAWLSVVVHSDAFQAQLRRKQETIFNAHVLPLGEKLLGLAHLAVDKVGAHLEKTDDPDYVHEVATTLLDRVGFHPKQAASLAGATVNVQNNVYQVDKATLEAARAAIGKRLNAPSFRALETPATE